MNGILKCNNDFEEWNAPFSPSNINSAYCRILCSPEHSKLCFELLELHSAAQNAGAQHPATCST